jgi:hypothetical protein
MYQVLSNRCGPQFDCQDNPTLAQENPTLAQENPTLAKFG